MKIAICGTHNTGKTTECMRFKEQGYLYVEEGIEKLRDKGIVINEQAQESDQRAIAEFILDGFNKNIYKGFNVVFDRCLLDVYAYSIINTNINVTKHNGLIVPCFFLEESSTGFTYLQEMKRQTEILDQIIIATRENNNFAMVNDGVRSLDDDFTAGVDNIFNQILEGNKLFNDRSYLNKIYAKKTLTKGVSPSIIL